MHPECVRMHVYERACVCVSEYFQRNESPFHELWCQVYNVFRNAESWADTTRITATNTSHRQTACKTAPITSAESNRDVFTFTFGRHKGGAVVYMQLQCPHLFWSIMTGLIMDECILLKVLFCRELLIHRTLRTSVLAYKRPAIKIIDFIGLIRKVMIASSEAWLKPIGYWWEWNKEPYGASQHHNQADWSSGVIPACGFVPNLSQVALPLQSIRRHPVY